MRSVIVAFSQNFNGKLLSSDFRSHTYEENKVHRNKKNIPKSTKPEKKEARTKQKKGKRSTQKKSELEWCQSVDEEIGSRCVWNLKETLIFM